MSVFTMCHSIGCDILNSNDSRRFLSLPWRDYTATSDRAMFVNSVAQLTVTLAARDPWNRADSKEPRWCVWRHEHGTPMVPVAQAAVLTGETLWDLWATIYTLSAGTPYADTLSADTCTAGTLTPSTR